MEDKVSIEFLWSDYLSGHRERYADIYLHYYPGLYTYGQSITIHAELIDEAIQVVFLRLWEKPPHLVNSKDQYIFVSFRNQLFLQLKKKNAYSQANTLEATIDESVQSSPEDLMIEQESVSIAHRKILNALQSLPLRRREAIYLKFIQQKSTKDISAIMDIREEMVRNYIHKGIKALREYYDNYR